MMTKKLLPMVCAALLWTGARAEQVVTLTPAQTIHQLRMYGDTIFVSTDAAISYYVLGQHEGWQSAMAADVVVYDFVRCGDRFLTAGTPGEQYMQNPRHPRQVFHLQDAAPGEMGFRLSKSADYGQTWWMATCPAVFWGHLQMAFNPLDDDEVVLYGMNEFVDCICPFYFRSSDGLQTLQSVDFELPVEVMPAYVQQLAFSPARRELMLMATPMGLLRSTDDGASWQQLTELGGGFFSHVTFDNEHPHVCYAVEQGAQTPCDTGHTIYYYVHRSVDDGASWSIIAVLPVSYDPDRGTTGLRDVQCHGDRLVAWADQTVYLVEHAAVTEPITNAVVQPRTVRPDAVYTLQGVEVAHPQRGGLYIKNGQKYVAQ